MTTCIENDSIIVTLGILGHGMLLDYKKLSSSQKNIFKNINFFSLSGEMDVTTGPDMLFYSYLEYLNKTFQQDLDKNDIETMRETSDKITPKYTNFLKDFLIDYSSDNICKIVPNITFDKVIGEQQEIPSLFKRFQKIIDKCLFNEEIIGIYVVAIHKKIDNNYYELMFPLQNQNVNLNLLNINELLEFAKLFNFEENNILTMVSVDSTYPLLIDTNDPWEREYVLEEFNKWKLTKNTKNITQIRLSYMIEIIKTIVGNDRCYLNIYDFTCSNELRSSYDIYPTYKLQKNTVGGKTKKKQSKKEKQEK